MLTLSSYTLEPQCRYQDPLSVPEASASLGQGCGLSSTSLGDAKGQELSATLADNMEI